MISENIIGNGISGIKLDKNNEKINVYLLEEDETLHGVFQIKSPYLGQGLKDLTLFVTNKKLKWYPKKIKFNKLEDYSMVPHVNIHEINRVSPIEKKKFLKTHHQLILDVETAGLTGQKVKIKQIIQSKDKEQNKVLKDLLDKLISK